MKQSVKAGVRVSTVKTALHSAGVRLKTSTEKAGVFRLSQGEVHKAYRALKAEGVLRQGVGVTTFYERAQRGEPAPKKVLGRAREYQHERAREEEAAQSRSGKQAAGSRRAAPSRVAAPVLKTLPGVPRAPVSRSADVFQDRQAPEPAAAPPIRAIRNEPAPLPTSPKKVDDLPID